MQLHAMHYTISNVFLGMKRKFSIICLLFKISYTVVVKFSISSASWMQQSGRKVAEPGLVIKQGLTINWGRMPY